MTEEINIKDFFVYLKKYIVVFVALVALAVIGVVIYDTSFKKPIYQANTTVVIAKSDGTDGVAATLNDINASQKLVTTYSEIAKSELVLNQVIENLDLGVDVKTLSRNLTNWRIRSMPCAKKSRAFFWKMPIEQL